MEFIRPSDELRVNPENPCPPEIAHRIVRLRVRYVDFEGQPQYGDIEIDGELEADVRGFFVLAHQMGFPMTEVALSSDRRFEWDDNRLMEANATSGFNYRTITGGEVVSMHGRGRAFDVNPLLNPYISRREDGSEFVAPAGATYRPGEPGVLDAGHPLVGYMLDRGWVWGGNWTNPKDYQHFEKPIEDK